MFQFNNASDSNFEEKSGSILHFLDEINKFEKLANSFKKSSPKESDTIEDCAKNDDNEIIPSNEYEKSTCTQINNFELVAKNDDYELIPSIKDEKSKYTQINDFELLAKKLSSKTKGSDKDNTGHKADLDLKFDASLNQFESLAKSVEKKQSKFDER